MGRGGPQPHCVTRPGDLQVEAAVVDIEDPEALPFGQNPANVGVYLVNNELALDGDSDEDVAAEYVEVEEQEPREDVEEEEGCVAGQACCLGDCNNNAVIRTNKVDTLWLLITPECHDKTLGDIRQARSDKCNVYHTPEVDVVLADFCFNNNHNDVNRCENGDDDPILKNYCGSDIENPGLGVKRSDAMAGCGERDLNQSMGGVLGTHSERSSPFNLKGGNSGEERCPDKIEEEERKGKSRTEAPYVEIGETEITGRDEEISVRSHHFGDERPAEYELKHSETPHIRRDAGQQVDLGDACDEPDRGPRNRCNKCDFLKILTKARDSQTNAENWTESEDVTLSDDPERTTVSGFSSTLWYSDRMSVSGRPAAVHISASKETLHSELYQIEGSCLLTEDCQINVEFHKLMDLMDNLKNSTVVASDEGSVSCEDEATKRHTSSSSRTNTFGRKFLKGVTFPEPVARTASSEFDLGTFFLERNSVGDYGLPLCNPIKPPCLQTGVVLSMSDCVLKATEHPRLADEAPKETEPKSPRVESFRGSRSYCTTPDSKDYLEMVSKSVNVNLFTETTSALSKSALPFESVVARDVYSPGHRVASRKSPMSSKRRSNVGRSHVCGESGENNTSVLSILRSLSPILSGCESPDAVSSSTSVDAPDQIMEPDDDLDRSHSPPRSTAEEGVFLTVRPGSSRCTRISEEDEPVSRESGEEKSCPCEESQPNCPQMQPSFLQSFSLVEHHMRGDSPLVDMESVNEKRSTLTELTYASDIKPTLLNVQAESSVNPSSLEFQVADLHSSSTQAQILYTSVSSGECLQRTRGHSAADVLSDLNSKSTSGQCYNARARNASMFTTDCLLRTEDLQRSESSLLNSLPQREDLERSNSYLLNSLPQNEDFERTTFCLQTLSKETGTLTTVFNLSSVKEPTILNVNKLYGDTEMLTNANFLPLSCDNNQTAESLKAEGKYKKCDTDEHALSLFSSREITADNIQCYSHDGLSQPVRMKTQSDEVAEYLMDESTFHDSSVHGTGNVLMKGNAESESINTCKDKATYLSSPNVSQLQVKSEDAMFAISFAEKCQSSNIAASEIFSLSPPSPRDVASYGVQCCSHGVLSGDVVPRSLAALKETASFSNQCESKYSLSPSSRMSTHRACKCPACGLKGAATISPPVGCRSLEFDSLLTPCGSTDLSQALQDLTWSDGGASRSGDTKPVVPHGSLSAVSHGAAGHSDITDGQLGVSQSVGCQPVVRCSSFVSPGMTPVFSHCTIATRSPTGQPIVSTSATCHPIPSTSATCHPMPSDVATCHPVPSSSSASHQIVPPTAICQPLVSPSATCQQDATPCYACKSVRSRSGLVQSPAPLSTISEVSSSSVTASQSDACSDVSGGTHKMCPGVDYVSDNSQQCVSTGAVSQPCVSTGSVSQPCVSTGAVSQPCVSTGAVSQPCVSTGAVSQPCVYTGAVSQRIISTEVCSHLDTSAEVVPGNVSLSQVPASLLIDASKSTKRIGLTDVFILIRPGVSPTQYNDATVGVSHSVSPAIINQPAIISSTPALPNNVPDVFCHPDNMCHGSSFNGGGLQDGVSDEVAYQRDIPLSKQSTKGKSLASSKSMATAPSSLNNEDGANKTGRDMPDVVITKSPMIHKYQKDESFLDSCSFAITTTHSLKCVAHDSCIDSVVNTDTTQLLEPSHSSLATRKDLVLPYICEKPRQRTPVTSQPISLPDIDHRRQSETEAQPTNVPAPLPTLNEQTKDQKQSAGSGHDITADQLWQKYAESQREKIRKKRREFFDNHLVVATRLDEGLTKTSQAGTLLSSSDAEPTTQPPQRENVTRNKSILKSDPSRIREENVTEAAGESVTLPKSKQKANVSFFKLRKLSKRRTVTFETPNSSSTCDTLAVQEDLTNETCREQPARSSKTREITREGKARRSDSHRRRQFSPARGIRSESSLQQCNTLEEVEALSTDDASVGSDLASLRADSAGGCGKAEALPLEKMCHGDCCGGIKDLKEESPAANKQDIAEVQWDVMVCNKLPVQETDILVYNVAGVRTKTLMTEQKKTENINDVEMKKNNIKNGELLNLHKSVVKDFGYKEGEKHGGSNEATTNVVSQDVDVKKQNVKDAVTTAKAEDVEQGHSRELTHTIKGREDNLPREERMKEYEVLTKEEDTPTSLISSAKTTKAVGDKQTRREARPQDVCSGGGGGGGSATNRAGAALKGRLPKLKKRPPRVIAESHYYHQSNTVNIIVKPINVPVDKLNVKVQFCQKKSTLPPLSLENIRTRPCSKLKLPPLSLENMKSKSGNKLKKKVSLSSPLQKRSLTDPRANGSNLKQPVQNQLRSSYLSYISY